MNSESKNQYFLHVDEKQTGPFDVSEIKKMLADGKILSSTLAWQEGLADWVSVSSLFVTSESADMAKHAQAPAAPVAPVAPSREPRDAGSNEKHLTFTDKLATSGKITAAQAKLEKIRRMDLPSAFRKLGEAAYSTQFDGSQLQEQYASIDALKQQIADLKKSPVLDSAATTMDKAKHQGVKAKQAIEAERMTHKLHGVFEAVGETISKLPKVPDPLQGALQQVRLIQQQEDVLNKELEQLRGKVTGVFAKPSRVAGSIC